MKVLAVIALVCLSSVTAFAPSTQNGAICANTELNAFATKRKVSKPGLKKGTAAKKGSNAAPEKPTFGFSFPKAKSAAPTKSASKNAKKTVAKKPGVTNPFAKKQVVKKTVAKKEEKPQFSNPFAKKPVAEKVVAKKPQMNNPFAKKPVAEKVVAKKPQMNNPFAKKPAAANKRVTSKKNSKISVSAPKAPSLGITFGGGNANKKVTPKKTQPVKDAKQNGFSLGALTEKVLGVKQGTTVSQAVFEMDLYNPVKTQNDYGARRKKNITTGKLSKNSYVPAGMTQEQYAKMRTGEAKAKKDRYNKYVAAGDEYNLFFDFYKNRGTDKNSNWRSDTNGHTMAKTKYDWDGDSDIAGGGNGQGNMGR